MNFIKMVQYNFDIILCYKCGWNKPRAKKNRNICRDCLREYNREYDRKNRDKRNEVKRQNKSRYSENRWADNLKRWYGITAEEYWEMFESQGRQCAICGAKEAQAKRVVRMPIDHNHTTGKVRGILCTLCNQMLGHAKDDIDILSKAIDYLEKND